MEVNRKLVFYRWNSADQKRPFVPNSCITRLSQQIHQNKEFSVLESDEYKTAILPYQFSNSRYPTLLRMLSLRGGANLPARWSPDSPLESMDLNDDEYSADVTHVAIWPDGVAAQDLYRDAPRLGRLSWFLRNKMHENVAFDGLYNADMIEKMKKIRGQVRSVHISLLKSEIWSQTNNPGAFRTLFPSAAGVRTPTVKVALGMGRRSKRDSFLDPSIQEAVFEIAENYRDQIDGMIIGGVNGDTGKVERVNLLNERLHVQRALPSEDLVKSVPRADDTFKSIEAARSELEQSGALRRAIAAQTAI